ncbi:MAG: DUF6756 family protein [Candidatus Sericytochromatia bacterium]
MCNFSTRIDIELARKQLNISKDVFCEVGIEKWKKIKHKFEEKFIKKDSYKMQPYWYWSFFKYKTEYIDANGRQYFLTEKLFSKNEIAYFFILDSWLDGKFWFYEGNIESINKIVYECCLDEYYILDKKYEWFMCCTHHLGFLGYGEKIEKRMRKFKKEEEEILRILKKRKDL